MWIQVRNIALIVAVTEMWKSVESMVVVYFDDEASAALNLMKNVASQIFLVDIDAHAMI